MSAQAQAFIETLAARGITLSVDGTNLRLHPWEAHRELTPEDWTALREHRQAIKAIVSSGTAPSEPISLTAALRAAAQVRFRDESRIMLLPPLKSRVVKRSCL